MSPLDLVLSKDGSLSLTKLAASTAHALMALGFTHLTWQHGFLPELWMLYGSFALGHAVVDKASVQFAAFKGKQLSAGEAP